MLIITLVEAKEAGEKNLKNGKRESVPAWTRVHWRRLFARLRAVMDWRVAVLGTALFAGVVGISALLFLAMPRFELANSLFLDRLIARHTHTGFSDTIRFGDVTDITQDTSVALRVEVPDPARLPAELYWRMIVLDQYHDGEFRTSEVLRGQGENYFNENSLFGNERGGGAGVWTFYLEPGVSRYLPLVGGFATLKLGARTDLHLNLAARMVALRSEPATLVAYRVTGMRIADTLPDTAPGMGLRSLGLGESERTALKNLANQIDGGSPLGAMEFARRATAWLAQRHGYALQMQLPPGAGDPLVRWLRSPAPGHCELFAGALVMELERAAGHPARVVAGFKGGDWNAFENYLMVRNSDAHAWCEVYDGTAGAWQRGVGSDAGCGERGQRRGGFLGRLGFGATGVGPELVGAFRQPADAVVPTYRKFRPAQPARYIACRKKRDAADRSALERGGGPHRGGSACLVEGVVEYLAGGENFCRGGRGDGAVGGGAARTLAIALARERNQAGRSRPA